MLPGRQLHASLKALLQAGKVSMTSS